MASRCNQIHFLNQRLSLWLLALVLTMTWPFSVTGSAARIQLRGEAGGNVTINCPFTKDRTFTYFYFQRGTTFVNGFHAFNNLSDVKDLKTWNNTRVDHGKTTVYMHNLKVSDGGDYQCHIQYSDSEDNYETSIHLNVTAVYSKPEVKVLCGDAYSCQVTCESHGGYPEASMNWSVPENQTWMVNNSKTRYSDTTLFNSSSTAFFNCTNGELHLSCFVGHVTSDKISVCTPMDKPVVTNAIQTAIVAVVVVVVISSITAVLLYWKYKKSKTGAAALDVTQEWGGNESEEETVQLNEKK